MNYQTFLTKASEFKNSTILVVGDIMLDVYAYGKVLAISPEAPIPIMSNVYETTMLGGAGNVANNLKSLGVNVHLLATIGVDDAGDEIKELLFNNNIDAALLFTGEKPTTIKTRFIGNNQQQIMRLDAEDTTLIDVRTQERILSTIDYALYDAIVICDYGKGMLPISFCQEIIFNGKAHGKKVLVDPKGTDYSKYTDAYIVKPNQKEFDEVLGEDETVDSLLKDNNISNIIATAGHEGMRLFNDKENLLFLTTRKDVYDVSGAGDTAIATLAACLSVDRSLSDAIKIANVASGIVVGKYGTAVVATHEIYNELCDGINNAVDIHTASVIRNMWKADGKRVGFTNGCFDLIHRGHISLLTQGRKKCDKLIVGINSDKSIKQLKGDSRPLQDENSRAAVLLALDMVDLVVIFDEDNPLNTINTLKPNVLFKGGDYTLDTIIGAEEVLARNGTVEIIPIEKGHSTSNLVKKLEE